MGKVKEKLIDAVIADLKKGFEAGDYTVLEELLMFIPNENLIHSLPEEDWKEYENVQEEKDYFQIVHKGYQNELQREEIQIHCGENGNLFLIKTEEGFIVDVYNQGEEVNTMTIWETDLTPDESDDDLGIEKPDPRNFSDEEVREFKEKWGQSHEELCAELGYDEVDTSDLIMIDFFWIEADEKWYNIAASMYTDREQEIANYLRLGK